jgi:hypothetical protein
MTPIEELRKGLDELGVKYTTDNSNDYEVIEWGGSHNLWWQFVYDPYEEGLYGELRLLDAGGSTHLTPEQAIAVTMGAGTCEVEVIDTGNEAAYEHYEHIMHCNHCNHEYGYVQYDEDGGTWMDEPPKFCPNCGAKVVSE